MQENKLQNVLLAAQENSGFGLTHSDHMPSERSTYNHNLPASVSSFIGREHELREIGQRLREHRLITLTGTGGTGKTRLALQAAAGEVDHFADGVWLVELAGLSTADLVAQIIAKVLALPEAPDLAPLEQLGAFLQAKHLLLVLDNCEHLIEECARITAFLLVRCPRLVVLATSREPLAIGGEMVLHIPPLSLPDPAQPLEVSSLLHYDALRLFVERAEAAEPSFHLTASNAAAVVEICRRLDGIPLALELAAGRVRGMGVSLLAARLDQRFRLLIGGDRSALPRHQTLRATIDWSYRLLSAAEQIVLRRLGIFAGDFTLEAAEGVCGEPDSNQNDREVITPETILDHLLQLVSKSLVQFNQDTGRYRLLETIRLFCLERLAEAGETQTASAQHLAWYLRLAEEAAPRLSGPEQAIWGARLEAEQENMRAALAWALDASGAEEAARLALAVWRFWHTHTYQREGLRWLERILEVDAATPLPSSLRPQLFNALGVLSNSLCQFEQATAYHTEALRSWRERGDRAGMAQALCDIGWQQFDEMHQDQARAYAMESLALARAVGDQRAIAAALFLWAGATIEGNPGEEAVSASQGELTEAISALEESLALWRALEDTSNMAKAMSLLARAEGKRGNHERAKPLLREAVRLLVQVGNYIDLQGSLVALNIMATHAPQQPEGARYAAQVSGMMAARIEKLSGRSPWDEGPFQHGIEQITAILGADAFAHAFDEGKQMTPADLVWLADQITAPAPQMSPLPPPAPPHPASAHSALTARELEVLRLVATGLTNAQVAQRLHVTPRTINAHLTAIYSKLGVSSRSGAIRYALNHQLG
jgi:predicted ATPase/DNA-binding CsgD family transcriptional regulator